jgi:hypothetical protein
VSGPHKPFDWLSLCVHLIGVVVFAVGFYAIVYVMRHPWIDDEIWFLLTGKRHFLP